MKYKFVTGMMAIVCVLIMMMVTFQPVAANSAYDNMVTQPDFTMDGNGDLHMVYSQLIRYYVSIGNAQVPKWQAEVFYKNNVGLSGHGNRWNAPIQISNSEADSSWPQVSVDSSTGIIYVSWFEENSQDNKYWYAGSDNDGMSFTNPRYGSAAPWPIAPNLEMAASNGVLTFTWTPGGSLNLVADIDADLIPDIDDAEPMVYNVDNFAIEITPDVVATDNELGVTIAIDYDGQDDAVPTVSETSGDFSISTGDYIEIALDSEEEFSAIIKMSISEEVPPALNEENLRMYRQEGDSWVVVTDWELGEFTGISTEHGYVWAYVKHFSTFTTADASLSDGDDDGLTDITEDTEPDASTFTEIQPLNFTPASGLSGNPSTLSILRFDVTPYNTYRALQGGIRLGALSGPINDMKLDIGNDGTVDWRAEYPFSGELWVGGLINALNQYLFTHYTNSPATEVSIPFRFKSFDVGSFSIISSTLIFEDATTANYLQDTSGDELCDGWKDLDGDFVYERAGVDGILGTADDELPGELVHGFDPTQKNIVGSRGNVPWNEYQEGINQVNGNLAIRSEDMQLKAKGHTLAVERTYNSLNADIFGPFGYGWSFNYGERLSFRTGSIDYITGDGSYYTFEELGGGKYCAPAGSNLQLTGTGPYKLMSPDGTIKLFGTSGHMIKIEDKNANSLSLFYNAYMKLIQVQDSTGLAIEFTYTSGRITSITDHTGRTNTYRYDSWGQLISRTDAMGNVHRYSYYNTGHRLRMTINPLGLYREYQYSGAWLQKVSRCTVGEYDFATSTKTPLFVEYSAVYSYPGHTTATDALGAAKTHIFGLHGTASEIRNPDNSVIAKEYDADINLVRETDGLGNAWENSYDVMGNRIVQMDPSGNASSTEFVNVVSDEEYISLPTKTVDKSGAETTYTYDANRNPSAMTDQMNQTTYFEFTPEGLLESQTRPNGATTSYTYDIYDNTLTETDALDKTVSYTYDALNRKVTMTDARGGVTQYFYDNLDRTTMVIDPLLNEEEYTYDALGNTLSAKSRTGAITTYDYDVFGRKISETDALGNTSYFDYDWKGNLIKETDKRGNSTQYVYDEMDRLVSVIDALGFYENYTYDANGNQLERFDKLGNRWWKEYDALGRVTHEFCPYSFAIQYEYDAEGRMTKKTDRMGYETIYEYDARGSQIRVLGAEGSDTWYDYDPVGNLIGVSQVGESEEDVSTWQYGYDLLGRKIYEITPLEFEYVWTYDEVGNLIEYLDANGQNTSYRYDALNRLTNLTLPGANLQDDFQVNITYLVTENEREDYGYPPIMVLYGLPIHMMPMPPRMAAMEKEYDMLGRLVREMWAVTDIDDFQVGETSFYNITYEYDANGNVIEMTDQFGLVTTYAYDELNRLVALTDPDGDTTTYQYDALGQLVLTTYPIGTRILQQYNAANLLTGIWNVRSDNTVISSFEYTYNLNANRVSMAEADGSTTNYAYDGENRLTSVTYPDGSSTQYEYDMKNNLAAMTQTTGAGIQTTYNIYDIENRLLQSGDTLYEYDNNGNMITGDTAYRYYSTYLDGYKVNWLVGVGTVGGGPINPTSSNGNTILSSTTDSTTDTTPATSYGYALDGRRIGKAGAVDMKYLYDGENVVYELWDDMTVRFTHPVKSGSCGSCGSCGNTGSIFFTDHPISMTIYDENGIPTKYYYLYDGLGSVTELIDDSGNVVNKYRYTPFGEALVRNELVYNPYQFTGRQYDAESELYHYRARAYSPDVGRFMQQDPAGMVDGANMYAYCGNDPVNERDPGGLGTLEWLKTWFVPWAWRYTLTRTETRNWAVTLAMNGLSVAVVSGLLSAACPMAAPIILIIAVIYAAIAAQVSWCEYKNLRYYFAQNIILFQAGFTLASFFQGCR